MRKRRSIICSLLALGGALAVYLAVVGPGGPAGDADDSLAGGEPVLGDRSADLEALIDRVIQAHGGEANLARFQAATLASEGTIHFWGRHRLTEAITVRMPDRWRIESSAAGWKLTKVLAADEGWMKWDNNRVEGMSQELLAEGRVWFYVFKLTRTLLPLKDKSVTLAPLGDRMLGGHRVSGVQVNTPGLLPINLFVDQETGLVARAGGRFQEAAGKEILLEFTYSEYEEITGIKFYTKMVAKRDGKVYMESKFTEITLRDHLADGVFEMPQAQP